MGSWSPCYDSDHMVWKPERSVAAHKPDSEANVPQDPSQRSPLVKLLAVCFLVAAVHLTSPAERDDAACEPLVLRFMIVLHKARPALALSKPLGQTPAPTGLGHVEHEDAVR